MPTTRQPGRVAWSHEPTPLMSAPLPTGIDARAGAGRRPSATASVSSCASVAAPAAIRGSSPSTRSSTGCSSGVSLRGGPGRVEVLPCRDDLGAEGAHALDLARVRVVRGEHDGRDAEGAGGVSHALAEVAGRHAGDRAIVSDPPLPRQGSDRDRRPAALERADRVDRLDFDDDRDPQSRRQPVMDVLRRIEEDGIDRGPRRADRVGRESRFGDDHQAIMPCADPARERETPEGTAGP